jgi:ADP-heptose:LPS heptosyltransferase
MMLLKIHPQSIAVFRALQLGDWLCAMPAMRALRHAYPQAHIALVGLAWSRVLVERFRHLFNEFIDFPGFPGLPEQPFVPTKTLAFLSHMQDRNFDLLLQMQGNGNVVNPLLMLCGAKDYAGFYRKDNFQPNPDHFLIYPDQGSEIHRHLKLMEFLGIPAQGDHLEYPLYEEDYRAFDALDLDLEPGGYVCIHPGARDQVRQWDSTHFARLADFCAEAGYRVVLTGVESERPLTAAVAVAMQHPVLDLTGRTTLGAVGVLIERSRLLISNDTGVSHVAVALRRPSVVITLTDEEDRWHPLDLHLHHVVDGYSDDAFAQALAQVKKRLAGEVAREPA